MKPVDATAATTTLVTGASTKAIAGAKVADGHRGAGDVEQLTPAPQDLNAATKAAARQIDSYLKSVGRELEFFVDDETGMTVVTVRETATGKVIRQIPNEEVLHLARHLATGSGAVLDLVI